MQNKIDRLRLENQTEVSEKRKQLEEAKERFARMPKNKPISCVAPWIVILMNHGCM
jgi:hypothetical protein